jgi:cellulase/cellobiase CelA1
MVKVAFLLSTTVLAASFVSAQNPYIGKSVWKSTNYASEVNAAAVPVLDTTLKAKILSVAQVPTFTWIDAMYKVANLPGYLTAATGKILQIVIYNLPDRDCRALNVSMLVIPFPFLTHLTRYSTVNTLIVITVLPYTSSLSMPLSLLFAQHLAPLSWQWLNPA